MIVYDGDMEVRIGLEYQGPISVETTGKAFNDENQMIFRIVLTKVVFYKSQFMNCCELCFQEVILLYFHKLFY